MSTVEAATSSQPQQPQAQPQPQAAAQPQQPQSQNQSTSPAPPDIQQLGAIGFKDWLKLEAGHRLMMMNDADRVLRQDAAVRDAHYRKEFGDAYTPDQAGNQDMIQLGDNVVHNHYPAPAAPAAPAATAPVAQTPAAPAIAPAAAAGMSTLAKAAIAAALMGVGGGAAIGVPKLVSALSAAPAAVQQQPMPDFPQPGGWRLRLVNPKKPQSSQ